MKEDGLFCSGIQYGRPFKKSWFFLTRKGWVLSPAYDINPNPNGAGLSLNITKSDNSLDYDLCLSVSKYFRWDLQEAKAYIFLVREKLTAWPSLAKQLKISKLEQNFMQSAFNC